MAGSLNEVNLIGNCGAEPEIRSVNNGKVANLRIATSEKWTVKATGEVKEKTEWHRVTVWNDGLVGVIEKYVHKGSRIFIRGQIETRKWQKDGVDQYSTEIVLKAFNGQLILLDGRQEGGTQASPAPAQVTSPQSGSAYPQSDDDSIPF